MIPETRHKIRKAYKNARFDFEYYRINGNHYKEFAEPLQFAAYNLGFEHSREFDEILIKVPNGKPLNGKISKK